jgi:lysophospholipase L1-like esterase
VRVSTRLQRILCLVFAVLATPLAAELTFRLIGFLPSAAEPDDDLGWRWAPHARYRFQEEGFSEGRFNRFGQRDVEREVERPAGVQRIALLGDSFAEGLTVPLEKTFAALVEKKFREDGDNVEILNFARSGMGPTEELIVLERDALRFTPDAVCLVYLPGNDISDALPQTTTDRDRPFAHRTDGQLALTFDFRNSGGYRLRKFINPLKRRSALVSWAIARVRRLRQQRIRAAVLPADPNPLVAPQGVTSLFTNHPEPLYKKAFDTNLAVLDEIHRVCASNHIPLGLVILPAYLYFTPGELADAGIDAQAITRRVQSWAAGRGVACLALQQPFEEEIARGARLHFVGLESWMYGHFNEAGNAFAARQMAPFLADLLARDNPAR